MQGAERRRAQGYRLTVVADDIGLVGQGFASATRAFAQKNTLATASLATSSTAALTTRS